MGANPIHEQTPDQSTLPWSWQFPLLACGLVAAQFGILMFSGWRQPVIAWPDNIHIYVPWAQRLVSAPLDLAQWNHPFYPVGYPLLLGFSAKWLGYSLAGKAVSAVGAAGILAAMLAILRCAIGARLALVAGAFLLANGAFLDLGALECPDVIAAAAVLWGMYAISSQPTARPGHLMLGGALLGGAYLLRYQHVVFLAASVAFLLIRHYATPRVAFRAIGMTAATWLIIALPQLGADVVNKATPIPFVPGQGVKNAVYISNDWVQGNLVQGTIADAPLGESLSQVGASSLLRHMFRNITNELPRAELVSYPLAVMAWPGLVILWRTANRREVISYLLLGMGLYVVSLSWYQLYPRVLLPLIPIMTAAGAALMFEARGFRLKMGSRSVPVGACAIVVLLLLMSNWYIKSQLHRRGDLDQVRHVWELLHERGLRGDAMEVAALGVQSYDGFGGDVRPFPIIYGEISRAQVRGWGALAALLRERRVRYLVVEEKLVGPWFAGVAAFDPVPVGAGVSRIYLGDRKPRIALFEVQPPAESIAHPGV